MYEYVFFDLDGTLTDPGEGITNSVAHALRRFGITPPDRAELYKFIGPPLKDSFAEYFGMTEPETALAVEYYREYYREKGIFENKVYAGAREMLGQLKDAGKKLVLATSKPDIFAHLILEHFNLSEFFYFEAGAKMDESRTKKAEVIAFALDECGLRSKTDSILMVGDREHDVLGAAAHGIVTAGVTFGYGSEEELLSAGAKYIAHSPSEIVPIALLDTDR